MVQIERVTDSLVLGEAPHWDPTTKSLYLVDIYGKKILRYKPETKQLTQASFAPHKPTFIIPVEGEKDRFVVTSDNELQMIKWDGESDKFTILEVIAAAPKATPSTTFNDGKCDSHGRLWAGTHSPAEEFLKTQPLGFLYTLNNKKLEPQAKNIKIANGLAFNDKSKKMFYIDSLSGSVDQFDLDLANGKISNRQVWFTLKKFNIPGIPDGMTIDTDGHLWVAIFTGSKVLKIDGHKKETLLKTIDLPAEQVTAVAFGGNNLDELYITTGCLEWSGKKLSPPENGAIYKITGIGSKGLPGSSFKVV